MNYLRCVSRNVAVVIGSILMTAGIAALYWMLLMGSNMPETLRHTMNFAVFICLLIGSILLALTEFGLETYKAYLKTKSHIKEYGMIDYRFASKYEDSTYCTEVGFNVAVQESQAAVKR